MGSYRWIQVAVLTLALGSQVLATERVRVDPYIKAGPGYTAASGSITGYVPTKSNQDLLLEAERKGWLGKGGAGGGGAKTPVTVKPKVKVPVSGIAGKAKNLAKLNPGRMAVGAATSVALAAVGWVMSDDNTKLQKKEDSVNGVPVSTSESTIAPWQACQLPASQTLNKIVVTNSGGVTYAVGVWPSTSTGASGAPSGYSFVNNCTDSSKGYWYNAQGYWPQAAARTIAVTDIVSLKRDLTEADYNTLDSFVAGQAANWLRDLLKESCEGSTNPQGCYDDLQKQSPPSISGPASVVGPTSTTSGTYTRPDGTTGTTSTTTQTNYNIRYGDNYFDYDTSVTTTTTKDGQQVSEETTTDQGTPEETPSEEDEPEEQYSFQDAEFPRVDPFYEQKYPDGLEGVWNQRKQDFDNSAFLAFLRSFIPSFSGTCPSWAMSFDLQAMGNFSSHGFNVGCYVFDFIGVVILVTALFTARMVTFGG
ncbi:hypothetical protein LF844_07120 [Metapseudomonas lalkuanensis]|uniref:hypothetical protein n=1 Tax=Metapseudomonas lalkuanensis TaxID=2604832 RepID=UPI001CF2E7B9|nr:hypothetical protein [Pseudomonas lalkuanensis]UCO99573.1 hypothetical protein LF844_07120 [Pseudomonas lalkuanensis]